MPEIKLTEGALKSLSTSRAQEEFYDSSFTYGGSFGVRVSANGRKVFFYIYSLAGRRRRMTIGGHPALSLGEARAKALAITKALAEGRDPAREKRVAAKTGRMTDLIELFLTNRAFGELAPKTRREYARILHREIRPRWGDRLVSTVSSRDITELLVEFAEDRSTPVLAARIRALLSKLFNFAEHRGLIEENPVIATAMVELPHSEQRVLSLEELREIWRLSAEETPPLRAIFRMLLLTGQRPSDVLAMRWSELALDVWNPGRGGMIPLTKEMKASLEPLPRNPKSPFVFAGTTAGSKRAAEGHIVNVRRAIRRITSRMSDGTPPWSVLDIRRSVEGQLSMLGIRPEIIERLMGRSSLLSRLPKSRGSFDYQREMKRALERYTQQLVPTPHGPRTRPREAERSAKVVELFPKHEE